MKINPLSTCILRWADSVVTVLASLRITMCIFFVSFPHIEISLRNCLSLTERDDSETWRSVFVSIRVTFSTPFYTSLHMGTKAWYSCLIIGHVSDPGVWLYKIHLGQHSIPSSLQTSKWLSHDLKDVGIWLVYFCCSNSVSDIGVKYSATDPLKAVW